MTLYKIARWNEVYETHETRKLVRLNWIPVPNKHDGLGFRMIAAEKDSAALFGVWNLLIQVASKSDRVNRGTLERDGVPLTARTLSTMTGFPERAIARALTFFSQPTIGWLLAEQWQTDLPLSPGDLPLPPGTHPDEGNGMEWKEGKEGKVVGRAAGAAPAPLSLDGFKSNPAYQGIDIDREHAKAVTWCQVNRKKLTPRRFVSWLNRIEQPLGQANTGAQKAKARECPGWKGIINRCYPDSVYAAGGAREAHRWEDLGAEAQQLCWAEWRKAGGRAA